eukprot:scaffold1172_cov247-Pinguiococcus_pyrenoidosus.AAC.6
MRGTWSFGVSLRHRAERNWWSYAARWASTPHPTSEVTYTSTWSGRWRERAFKSVVAGSGV